jgi:hypothetical protein
VEASVDRPLVCDIRLHAHLNAVRLSLLPSQYYVLGIPIQVRRVPNDPVEANSTNRSGLIDCMLHDWNDE